MEMTFPHFAPRQDSVTRSSHYAMLAPAIARQANSQTVRAMRQAESAISAQGDPGEKRIHYFAQQDVKKMAVRGAFWRETGRERTSEQTVYHAGSTNIKVRDLEDDGTGEQLNYAGHGALRKL